MRLLLPSVLLLFFTSSSVAQINKGSVLAGLSFSLQDTRYDPDDNVDYTTASSMATVAIGKAIRRNLVVGASVGYDRTRTHTLWEYQRDGFGAGVFARKYVEVARRFYLFGEASAGYYQWKTSQLSSLSPRTQRSDRTSQISLRLAPGISYQLARRFHLELAMPRVLSANYSKSETKFDGVLSDKTNQYYLNTGLGLSDILSMQFGFRFLFNAQ